MSSILDAVLFNPASSGTGSFVVASAVTGFQTPAQAGAVNGATYSYRAESADLSQWEVGRGVYNTATSTLTRATVLYNSSGGTSAINFTLVPQVGIVALATDIAGATIDNTLSGLQAFSNTTEATSATAAAATFAGGVGINKKLFVTGNASFAGTISATGSITANGTIQASPSSFNPASTPDGAAVVATGAFGGGILMKDGTGRIGLWSSSTGAQLNIGVGGTSSSVSAQVTLTSSLLTTSTGLSVTGNITAGPSGTGTTAGLTTYNGSSGSGGGYRQFWMKNGTNYWQVGFANTILGTGTSNDFQIKDQTGSINALTIASNSGAVTFGASNNVFNFATPGAGAWYDSNTTSQRFFVGTDASTDAFRIYAGGIGSNALAISGGTGVAVFYSTVASTSTITGAVTVGGGLGVAGRACAASFAVAGGCASVDGVSNPVTLRVDGFYIQSGGSIITRSSGHAFGMSTTSGTNISFFTDNGSTLVSAGSISSSGSTTAYNTTSDERVKMMFGEEDIDWGDRIDRLWVGGYQAKDNPDQWRLGIRAQQAYGIVPQGVQRPQKPEDMYQVDYSLALAPLTMWGVKDLRPRVAALEAEIVELKSRLAA